MSIRQVIIGLVALAYALAGPIDSTWPLPGAGWVGLIILVPVAWLFLESIWREWQPDDDAEDRLSRVVAGIVVGASLATAAVTHDREIAGIGAVVAFCSFLIGIKSRTVNHDNSALIREPVTEQSGNPYGFPSILRLDDSGAERIINAYGKALAVGAGRSGTRKLSQLPYSIPTIKYAYYVYVAALVRDGMLTQSVGSSLVSTYNSLTHFIIDREFLEIEAIADQIERGEIDPRSPEATKYADTIHRALGLPIEDDINYFIQELYREKAKLSPNA